MLKTMYKALTEYIAKANLPVYPADCVPDDATFPYITLAIDAPLNAASEGRVTLTLWCLGTSAAEDRSLLCDTLLAMVPPRGLWLSTANETLLLTMKHPAQALQEKTALGMRILWTLRRYPKL